MKERVEVNKEKLSKKEIKPMSIKDFKDKLKANRVDIDEDFKNGILHLKTYEAISKFKSIRRAIRRGHVSPYGEIFPHRPFNNVSNSLKRGRKNRHTLNEIKKDIYVELNNQRRPKTREVEVQ